MDVGSWTRIKRSPSYISCQIIEGGLSMIRQLFWLNSITLTHRDIVSWQIYLKIPGHIWIIFPYSNSESSQSIGPPSGTRGYKNLPLWSLIVQRTHGPLDQMSWVNVLEYSNIKFKLGWVRYFFLAIDWNISFSLKFEQFKLSSFLSYVNDADNHLNVERRNADSILPYYYITIFLCVKRRKKSNPSIGNQI